MSGKVDWKHARDAVGGDLGLLLEVIEIFFAEHPKLMAGIESSIESEACVKLRQFAHSLKGCLRYFGETQAVELALDLEIMGRDEQIERAAAVFGELRTEVDSLLPELKAFVESQSPDSDA